MKNLFIFRNFLVFLFFFSASLLFAVRNNYLDEKDIYKIYSKHVAPNFTNQNKLKFHPLPIERMTHYQWEGHDFPRIIAIMEFEDYVKEYNLSSKKGLAVNDIDPEWLFIKHDQIKLIDYAADPKNNDLHRLRIAERDFDFIMVNQTLEHVYDPILCLQNLARIMKKNGILYFNVPANNIPHSTPYHHYTGFTATGIGCILQAAGFEILSIGQFGNKEYLDFIFKNHTWPDYTQLINPGINEFENPAIIWAFAKKN